jgi:hypothetical protein
MIEHAEARRLVSLDRDGALDPTGAGALHQHLRVCPTCSAYASRVALVGDALRDERVAVPDVRAGVLAAIGGSGPVASERAAGVAPGAPVELAVVGHHVDVDRRRVGGPPPGTGTAVVARSGWLGPSRWAARWLPAAACLVVGLLIGSVLVGGWRTTPTPAAAQVPERVAAAQFDVASLSAELEIVERGWNEQVPSRTFAGTIDYQAPETLAMHLVDTTAYPTDDWVANDVDLVLHDRQWWARGPRACPSAAQPGCTSPDPRLAVIDNVSPHDDGAALPLDLVVPVRSFLRSPEPRSLGARTIDGHDSIGVEVSAAQVAPLLDGLRPAGNLRELFASDVVSLWLDATTWTPLRFEVRASDDPDRRTWAIDRGYVERPGDEILAVALRDQRVNQGVVPQRLERAPEGGVRRDAGFVPLPAGGTATTSLPPELRSPNVDPGTIPDGLVRSTAGVVGAGTPHATLVETWSGGSGWVKVASTAGWDGTRLFGDLGSPVRRTTAGDGSVTYASLDGSRVAVHADGLDVVVTGSLDAAALARIADGLGVRGTAVPADWDEAATESVESATDLLPELLVPTLDAGFDVGAVRADGNVVTQAYAGAGSRGFVLVEAPGEQLSPPLDMAVSGVRVRGRDGRFSASRGELEWVEADRVHRITSSTLTRAELLAIAEGLVPA